MIIDLVFVVLLCLAIFKGHRKGLIVGVFSYLAFIVGLAAAIKLSAYVAGKIGQIIKVSDKWLPFIAFIIVFLAIVLLIKWLAKLIQYTFEKVMLGWMNRLGGVLLFSMIYLSAYAIFLFYINQLKLLPESTISKSATFSFIESFGKRAIDSIGYIIPAFRNMFEQLEGFFSKAVA